MLYFYLSIIISFSPVVQSKNRIDKILNPQKCEFQQFSSPPSQPMGWGRGGIGTLRETLNLEYVPRG